MRVSEHPGSDRRSTGFLVRRQAGLWQNPRAGDGVEEILTSQKRKTPTPSLGSLKS